MIFEALRKGGSRLTRSGLIREPPFLRISAQGKEKPAWRKDSLYVEEIIFCELPREVVHAHLLEVFRTRLDGALSTLV